MDRLSGDTRFAGAEGATYEKEAGECSDYEHIMAHAASRTNLSGNRTEKILDRYS